MHWVEDVPILIYMGRAIDGVRLVGLGELGDVSLLRPFIETIGTDVNVPRLMLSSLKKLESESNLLAEEACFVNTLAVHTEDDDVHDVAREVRHDTAKLRIHKHTADASLRAQIPLAQFQN